ncbi:hypothetical protein JH06_3072 [Blastocystis sp. subtype 4]|uniref:hypothetical protein n=1 Tax=Blastocystis sp. subtype 4 TaxID=944170 RepID=UPI0007112A2E|nr:hypothetical protein JH06_3072 [Blastocystis sp. subtype 4]KNB43122.1 hypothetical protein JH06_3072 [Blastocystis sp. subtype 4]|eukprot:XP_014526565.1 hypothetical protein JH06_3072 [Blastocystis sp. subtype 4]
MRLRNEISELFRLAGIDHSSLLTVGECVSELKLARERVSLHLVDHNTLSPEFCGFEDRVVEIIDHRKDEGRYPHVTGSMRTISYDPTIERGVGSCCTLIAEKLRQCSVTPQHPVLASLLEGVILLDTLNLSPTVNKTTLQDISIVHWLQSFVSIDQESLYKRLFNSKYDPTLWKSMSIREAFEYDYKVYQRNGIQIGWSAVLIDLSLYMKKESYPEELDKYCRENKLDVFIFSSVLSKGTPKREIAFYLPRKNLEDKLNYTETLLKAKFHLKELGPHFWTTDTPISRKGLAPMIMDSLT